MLWPALLLAILSLPLSACCASPAIEKPAPPLPVRPSGPRVSWDLIETWLLTGRLDLLVAELERERAYSDAMARDGHWDRGAAERETNEED